VDALAVASLAVLVLTNPALGQDGTPATEEQANPRVVPAAECVDDPLSVDALSGALGLDADGVPMPAYPIVTGPLGEVADPATAISIHEAAREVLACFNAGDIPRAAALMTAHGAQRSYWRLTTDATARESAKARIAAAPQPRPDALQIRLLTVTDVSQLPDGRLAAFVVLNDPLLPPAGPKTMLFIFAPESGKLLLDDWIDFTIVPPDYGAAATPST
jgi:hypothetical protein